MSIKLESGEGKGVPDEEGGNTKRGLSKVIRDQLVDLTDPNCQVLFAPPSGRGGGTEPCYVPYPEGSLQ